VQFKEKPLSKRALRRQQQEEMQRKQLEVAYQFPFCRRCKEPLEPKWASDLKKKGMMPLCPKCFEPMMDQFKKCINLWQKFKAR
jgi:predicted amidophosphoribosyltransferase